MPLTVASHRMPLATLRQRHGEATVLDVTSRGPEPWVRFSPFYPHGGIPVPYSPDHFSMTVEGIWQGLKVFERADVDPSRFTITSMKGIKRSARTHGKVLGHRAGLTSDRLLSYGEARRAIYLPAYRWTLEHCLQDLLGELRRLAASQTVLLLDYETNCNVDDLTRPLSHACLIKRYLEDDWPV